MCCGNGGGGVDPKKTTAKNVRASPYIFVSET